MFLIYTHPQTNRLRYTFDFVFGQLLQIDYELTDDKEAFLSEEERPKLSYTNQPLEEEVFFYSTPLLFEKGIRTQPLKVFEYRETKVFFAAGEQSALPFDPFAAIFYLLSRYEEYLPYHPDKFGRFPASESLAYKHDFLHRPVIDHWGVFIKDVIQAQYPQLNFPKRSYRFIPTYDIDTAFAYKHKGLLRTIGGYAKSLYQKDWPRVKERTQVLLGRQKDPFNTFDWLHQQHKHYTLHPIFFFLVGDYGEYDRNISPYNNRFQSLIKSTGDYAEVGLHPSYASNDDPELLKIECERLEQILKRDVKQSRQHYLKFILPRTYQNLVNLEIRDDYTMGYASKVGFRAGTCTPFQFFDLDYESASHLTIHPFAIMDASLREYLGLSPDEASRQIKGIIEEVQAVNGTLVTLWHNSSISEKPPWTSWTRVYEELLQMATKAPNS